MTKKTTSRAKKTLKRPQDNRRAATPNRRPAAPASDNEDYGAYLERHEMYGDDRPRLSSAEFNHLDDELLDLLAQAEAEPLSDDQMIRLRELEFLLLDEQSDAPF